MSVPSAKDNVYGVRERQSGRWSFASAIREVVMSCVMCGIITELYHVWGGLLMQRCQ